MLPPTPVNLYVDRLDPVQPVSLYDVYSASRAPKTQNDYTEAAFLIGLDHQQRQELADQLLEGNGTYVPALPRRLDAMAGKHHRSGKVYSLRNVSLPANVPGWQITLSDGTRVYVPRECGNLSVLWSKHRPKTVATLPHHHPVSRQHVSDKQIAVAPTPIVFVQPVTPVYESTAVESAPVQNAPLPAGPSYRYLPYIAAIGAAIGGAIHNGNQPSTPAFVPPPCSLGSNSFGACSGK